MQTGQIKDVFDTALMVAAYRAIESKRTDALFRDLLAAYGYQTIETRRGMDALELARQHSYDVALLDYRMPGMDGLTLYREIKRLRSGTVAIVVTAYAGGGTSEEALQAGAWRVLIDARTANVVEVIDRAPPVTTASAAGAG